MKYKIVFQLKAKAELQNIRKWLMKQSPISSIQWLEKLSANIHSLEEMPYRFPKVSANKLPVDVRSMVFNPYRIFYRVVDDKVYILHIRHTALPPLK
jgi:plasmid stabilization system protein ParE